MAAKLGILVILTVITMIEGVVKPCTNKELLGLYLNGTTRTTQFIENLGTVMVREYSSGVLEYQSLMENCGVTVMDNTDAEIIMAFKVTQGPDARYCMKGYLNNYAMFYTRSLWQASNTGFTVDQCIDLLKFSTAYTILVKNIPPITTPRETPQVTFPGVDYSSIVKPGTYRMEFRVGYGNPAPAFQCTGSAVTQSWVIVTNVAWTFVPCTFSQGTTPTTYLRPFDKPLPILGYAQDTMLNTAPSSLREQQSFVALAYPDGTNSFKYLVLRVAVNTISKPTDVSYLQVETVINPNEFPTGFVHLQYVPSGTAATNSIAAGVPRDNLFDILTFRLHSSECRNNPCVNGGTCIQNWQSFKCICSTGYSGDRCEIKPDACIKTPTLCTPNGQCETVDGGHTCKCNPGFTGPDCTGTTDCLSTTCKNGGTCKDRDGKNGNSYCICPAVYSGNECQLVISCKPQPCKNSAKCYDMLDKNDYFCLCVGDWTGKNCDQPLGDSGEENPKLCIPDSAIEICQNGGICIDFKCVCKGHYIGKFCHITNPWFIGSIVLITLMILMMLVTLIVCCFCCMGGRQPGDGAEKGPYNPFDRNVLDTDTGYAPSTQGYGPTGFTVASSPLSQPPFLTSF